MDRTGRIDTVTDPTRYATTSDLERQAGELNFSGLTPIGWDAFDLFTDGQLDVVYDGIVLDHRRAIAHGANYDPVSEGILTDQTAVLEMQQWFIRSFLRGTQPDEDARRFGSADRAPTSDEAAAAPTEVSEETSRHYEEMATTGANAKGEGAI